MVAVYMESFLTTLLLMETANDSNNLCVSCSAVVYNYVRVIRFILHSSQACVWNHKAENGRKALGLCIGQEACCVGPGLNFSIEGGWEKREVFG